MRSLFFCLIALAFATLSADTPPSPDLSRELRAAADAIGALNGIELEPAIVKMRTLLDEARVSDDFGAALTLLDLTAGPGVEKLRSVTSRYAVGLAPHLPEAHLRHAQRLYADGFETRYWLTALGGYFRALDQPLFLRPLRDAVAGPLHVGLLIPALLLLLLLFLRHCEALSRRYGIAPLAAVFALLIPWSFALLAPVLTASPVGLLFALLLAAFLFPALSRRERWLLLPVTLLLLLDHGLLTALGHLPPAAPESVTTPATLLSFTAPGSAGITTAPYLFHESAFRWLLRHGLYAFFSGLFLFFSALFTALLLARHSARYCVVCGVPIEQGRNARPDGRSCIICEHIAERPRQIREPELRRYREQAAFRRRRKTRLQKHACWLAPGAGLLLGGRVWEGAAYLFGAAGLLSFAALWIGAADLLALYRPLTTAPAMRFIILAAALYGVSVARTYLTERRS